jgi:hypothetical protein
MGIKPALGSFFQASQGRMGGSDPVLVLGYSFWKTHLGGDPGIVGRNVSVNGHPVTIIGVAPKGFCGVFSILDTQGYLPIGMAAVTSDSKNDFLTDRKANSIVLLGWLKPGAKLGEAQPMLNVVARRLSEHIHQTIRVTPAMEAGITDWVWELTELLA